MKNLSAISTALLFLLCVLLGACSSSKYSPFIVVDPHGKTRGEKLAVVSGLNTDFNRNVAVCIENALRTESVFQIMSQKEVARLLPHYRSNIQGPYTSAYFNIETDYKRTDVKKITKIQRELSVDYIYAVWAPIVSSIKSPLLRKDKIVYIRMVGQLYSFPGTREVGHGVFVSSTGKSTGFFAPTPEPKHIEESLREKCNIVAKEIARKTDMQKRSIQ